ncbi:sugar transferase [Microlunatus antarcticus]|uniref:Exopolysaccharide biosynthesis polyprenyl glycosylphosphotransferase n=1 Tax=Microlunatus antarcticus TaxID=53388 RepID=A0A7W5P5I4_9ACTN|nr:sugar transferase [Microlunatus antarcticus]MBB3325312.1 exopolysaccharide biosynthesis polyprenyl glycosylphosphotransferase [Microlunatus antarcticus]
MSTQELDGLDLLGQPLVATPVRVVEPVRVTPPVVEPVGHAPVALPVGPRFGVWARRYVAALTAWDVLVGATAALVPSIISETLSSSAVRILVLGAIGAVVWPLAVGAMKGYQRRAVGVGSDEVHAVLRAWVAVVVAGAVSAELVPALLETERDALLKLAVTGTPFAVALSVGGRFAARKFLHRQQRAGRLVRRVVVAGSAAAASQLIQRLANESECGMTVVGVCVPDAEVAGLVGLQVPVLGDLRHVGTALKEHACDTVAVTSDDATRFTYLRELSWSLEGSGVEMLVDPGLVEVAGPRMHIRPLVGFPLLHIEEPHFTGPRRAVKRTTDILLTGVGLLVISPLMLLIALAIKLQDGGPVIFAQTRIGRSGAEFTMYKFRSMRIGAENELASLMERNQGKGGLFKLSDDPRITRLGRFLRSFSLDELPQLLNVLNGTMSLVGPRPHLAHELALMPAHSSRRALVTPGLTGLWQVSGRSHLEGDAAVQLDLRYVENWSLTLDLLILWKTFSAVLRRVGAA